MARKKGFIFISKCGVLLRFVDEDEDDDDDDDDADDNAHLQ